MSTHMHMFAEQNIKGSWHFIGEMEECYDYGYFDNAPQYQPSSIYDIQNYSLFAIIANVRNSYEEKFEPISSLRGLPDNLSPELAAWYAYLQTGETGETIPIDASWLTLEELADFDWPGKRRKVYAIVDKRVAHLFHPDRPFPLRDWPEDIQCGYSRSHKNSPECNAIWTETYEESVGPGFMQDVLAQLLELHGTSNDVHLVFDFSS